jgi:homogentisate 1,2-dioxygenase
MDFHYQTGFCNDFATEAMPGALPDMRNSPQRCPYGLYAEQFSGTAFTAPRYASRRSWLYRIRPAAVHGSYRRVAHRNLVSTFDVNLASPNQLRWSPLPILAEPLDIGHGVVTLGGPQ